MQIRVDEARYTGYMPAHSWESLIDGFLYCSRIAGLMVAGPTRQRRSFGSNS
jgi:hypothetical protein